MTVGTVSAAIDLIPEAVLIPCTVVNTGTLLGAIETGCPDGWVLHVSETDLIVSSATPTSYNYAFTLNGNGSIPIRTDLDSCTLAVDSSGGIPATGTATFLRSNEAGPLNRLQFQINSISYQNVHSSGCGALSGLFDFVLSMLAAHIESLLSIRVCGAPGPELFGQCP